MPDYPPVVPDQSADIYLYPDAMIHLVLTV